MAESGISILKKLMDARNRRAWNEVMPLISDELVIHAYSLEKTFKGKQGFPDFFALWDKAFPDGKVSPIQLHESGDCVIAELKGEGTQRGVFDVFGSIQPTGRHIEIEFCDIFQFKDGKLVELRSYLDLAALFKQLGVLTITGKAKAA